MQQSVMSGLLTRPRLAGLSSVPCMPSTSGVHHAGSIAPIVRGTPSHRQSGHAAWLMNVTCYAKRASKAASGGGAEEQDQGGAAPPRRRTRKAKEETPAAEAAAAQPEEQQQQQAVTEAEPAPRRRGRKPKAEAAQVAVPEPEPAAESPAAAEIEEEQEAEADSSATSVLEESVRRRGRPRIHNVLDEYAPPVSPAEEEEEVEEPLIISDEVVEALKEIEPGKLVVSLGEEEEPRILADVPYAQAIMSERYWVARRKEAKDIEELAWQCHHHQNRYAANRYLTVRRVARLMAEVENHDFMREADAPHHVPPWARAELVFKNEFDEFNEYVKENMARIGGLSHQMEEADDARERSANIDMLNGGTADLFNKASDMEKVTKATSDQLLMDLYLDNILPGASLSSMNAVFADDIFTDSGDAGDDLDEDDGAGVEDALDAAPAPSAV